MRPVLSAALLLIVTAAIYAPTLGYGYVFEDRNDLGHWGRSVWSVVKGWQPEGDREPYQYDTAYNPARLISMTLDGLSPDPSVQHAMSVGLHLVNVLLLLALAWLVLPPWGAVLAGAVFALHPINVEAVAYVSARPDLLAGTGVLLALLAASLGSLPGAVCGLVLASLGKEAAIMAWAVVPLWAWTTRAAFPVKAYLVTAATLTMLGAAVFLNRVTEFTAAVDLSLIGRTAAAVMRLTSLVFLPVGFTVDHDWQHVPVVASAAAVVTLVSLTGWALWTVTQRRSWGALAWLVTLLWCLPRFVIPNVEGLHEHHFYNASYVWALAIGGWFSQVNLKPQGV